jgi:hypothetical protein
VGPAAEEGWRLDPEEQLAALRSATFTHLRPLQDEALRKIRTDYGGLADIALEMPTGSGKTLVGLLLASQVMSDGYSVIYLTGTIQLSHQVAEEAGRLGLAADVITAPLGAVSITRINRIETGRTLGVLNYWAYFSERDLFDPPGLLIVDDAHLLEDALASRYGISVSRGDDPEVFASIYGAISDRFPGYQVVDDAVAEAVDASRLIQLIAFPHAVALADTVRTILDPAAAASDRLRWAYPRIAARLANCLWLAGRDEFTIRPLRFPLPTEARYAEASQRLLMSATLGDLADLRRRLGTGPISKVELSPELGQRQEGRRFLVLADTPDTAAEIVAARDRMAAATPRRVWFCRSKSQAQALHDELAEQGRNVMAFDREGQIMSAFVSDPDADLVIGGRFDGIDFAGDDARLAVFPSMPYGIDPLDEFMTANFGRASFLQGRVAERLTQALGRMTRSADDWAVVVLEDPRLAHKLVQRDVSARLPKGLWAEIQDALQRAEDGPEAPLALAEEILRGIANAPVSGDWRRRDGAAFEWSDSLQDLEERFGANLHAGTFDAAIPAAVRLLEQLGDGALRPWWLYLLAHAEYLSAIQDNHPQRAQQAVEHLQMGVRAAGPTAWFARVEASVSAARTGLPVAADALPQNPLSDFVGSLKGPQYRRWVAEVGAGLASGEHDATARSWTEIGRALGYTAVQPETDAATDSLWRGSEGSYVFEVKVEHLAGNALSRRDVNQLLGQVEDESGTGRAVTGCFITTLGDYHPAATVAAGRLVAMPLDLAVSIWERVALLLEECRSALAAGHDARSLTPPTGWLPALMRRGFGRFLTSSDLASAWPRKPPTRR